jgi:hypothetical protein
MAVDVIIDPGTGQIYWNDQAGSGTQTIAISGNATNAINVVGYSNFFSAGGGGLGTQILATFTDSPTSTFTPGTNAYDLGSSSLRWNFYGTGGNFTGAISTSSSTASTSTTTGALIVSGGLGVVGDVFVSSATGSKLSVMQSSGDEGGEIFLNKAVTNTTITTGITIDVYQNRLRFFETGGTNRGAYLDLVACSASVATNLLSSGSGSGISNLNGLTATTQTFATGTSGTDFNISSSSSTHTFNIPYAGAASTGLITTQAQTIAGAKTFSSQTIISDTTASTTTATGSLLVFGGLGVSGQVNAASLQTTGNAVISGNLTFNGVGVFGNATSDTINSLARYISDILPSVDNSYDLGNNSLGWRNFKVSGVGTIATLQVTSITAGVWGGTAISAVNGGTGQVSYTIGDILYASSTSALSKLAAGTAGSVLKSNGAGTAPSWQVDSTGSGGAGTVAAPSASNLIAYYPGTGASVASTPFVSIESTNSAVEISSQNSKSALILNAANGSVVNLAEFKGPFGDVFWSFGTTGQELKGTNGQLKLNSASYISLVSPATVRFYNTAETFYTAITGSTTVSSNVTYTLPPTAPATGTSVLQSSTGGTLSWVAMTAGGGSGTVTSGTAGSIAYYTGTGTTVGGSPGFTYTTSGTASTINVFGGSAIGTTIFTVQATSSTSVRVGIGTNLPQYELEIVGELSATNKSFVIDHPTKPGKKLRYGSLEGPENGVYVRGELKGSNIIETPDHWIGLVYPDSFTVTLTPISRFSHLYVEKIEDYKVFIADDCMNPIHCYYTVWAERKDIPKLITEY